MPLSQTSQTILAATSQILHALGATALASRLLCIGHGEKILRTQAKLSVKCGDWSEAKTAWEKLINEKKHRPGDLSDIGKVCRIFDMHLLYQRAINLKPNLPIADIKFPETSSMTNAVRLINLEQKPGSAFPKLVEKVFSNKDISLELNLKFYNEYGVSLEGILPALEEKIVGDSFTALYFSYVDPLLLEYEREQVVGRVITAQHELARATPYSVKNPYFPRLLQSRLSKFTSRYRLCCWRLFFKNRTGLTMLIKFKSQWRKHKGYFCSLPRYLAHGDFRTRNVIITKSKVKTFGYRAVIIDWDNWGYAPFGTDLAFYLRDSQLAGTQKDIKKYIRIITAHQGHAKATQDLIFSLLFVSIIDHVHRLGRQKHRPSIEEINSLEVALIMFEKWMQENRNE